MANFNAAFQETGSFEATIGNTGNFTVELDSVETFEATFQESDDFDVTFNNSDDLNADMGQVMEVVTSDHRKLQGRNAADQHPISAITGLEEALEQSAKRFNVSEDFSFEEDTLILNKATVVEPDNTKAITAAAVYTEVGNITALLQTI